MNGRTLADDARRTISAIDDPLSCEFMSFIDNHPDALSRACDHGHITASALVVDVHAGRALLMLHAKVGRWLQMGGHVEPTDPTLRAAALREAQEESGILGLEISAEPVRLDRHGLLCGGRALDHLDVQFLAFAPQGAQEQANDESHGLRWVELTSAHKVDNSWAVDDAAVLDLLTIARSLISPAT